MNKLIALTVILLCLSSLPEAGSAGRTPAGPAAALPQDTDSYHADLELARRYAPVFYFHPDEIYRPQPVEVSLAVSRLRQNRRFWMDTNLVNAPTLQDLISIPSDRTNFLDQWFGDSGSSEHTNYTAHHAFYQATLCPQAGGPAPVSYAHVVRDENPHHITIQYWVYYFYQNWFNTHEGDWEMVELVLAADGQPQWTIYSQHHGGTRRTWENTPREEDTHPAVFAALGSHANYFAGDENYPYGQDIGNERIDLIDHTGYAHRLVPEVVLVPTREELEANLENWPGAGWLLFRGRWGETSPQGDFNGPYGPADKGLQWEQPLAWGLEQPLDIDTWYKNRLQVEIARPENGQDHIWLTGEDGKILPQSESLGSRAILHADPPGRVLLHVQGAPGTRWGMTIQWPDPLNEIVTQMRFLSVDLDETGEVVFDLSMGSAAPQRTSQVVLAPAEGEIDPQQLVVIQSAADRLALLPSEVESFAATWDAPDMVWMGGMLPSSAIPKGLLIALLYSVVPTLIFTFILHWANRYRKEPVRRLAAAFLWGAIPAVVLALTTQLLFKLPPRWLGADALEAVRLGLVGPVLEESLKAAGVWLIYRRWKREITDVLDGMVYGAAVGFGFAVMLNLLRYIGNFVTWGFTALDAGMLAELTVNTLNHGLYTATFGAGLGYAMLSADRRRFRLRAVGALAAAIAVHALHNMLANSLVGLNAYTVLVTSAGLLVLLIVAAWSMVKQRQLMQAELMGLVNSSLYRSVCDPLTRHKAQWEAFRYEGFGGLKSVRRLQGKCIELANTRLEARLIPEGDSWMLKADALLEEIKRISESMQPIVR